MKEEFRDIAGYEGLYQVSNLGNVKNCVASKILKPIRISNEANYQLVVLLKNGVRERKYIHRLVLETFKPRGDMDLKDEDGRVIWVVDHINNIKNDNRLENLQWLLNSKNIKKETQRNKFKKNLRKAIKEV